MSPIVEGWQRGRLILTEEFAKTSQVRQGLSSVHRMSGI